MNTIARRDTFPRGALIGAGLLLLLTVTAAALGRHAGNAVAPQATVTAQRELRFADRADGAVLVYDAGSTAPIRAISGQAGFLRGTLRALARERRIDGLGPRRPFRLVAWSDGRLTLEDTATGARIELEAFGVDNERVFARLLTARGDTP